MLSAAVVRRTLFALAVAGLAALFGPAALVQAQDRVVYAVWVTGQNIP